MTTFTLLVVIIVLTCNLAILYLPFDNKKKVQLSLIVAAGLLICCVSYNVGKNEVPVHIKEKIAQTENIEAQKSMMATFNVTEGQLNTTTETPTYIEFGVTVMLVLALVFTPLLIVAVRDENNDTIKEVHLVALTLNALACGLLLSLYYGLKIPTIPYVKMKKSEEGETLPTLS
jgi:4-amino-4-deoxy-L-arabinose transferase-like glycosyltransferase